MYSCVVNKAVKEPKQYGNGASASGVASSCILEQKQRLVPICFSLCIPASGSVFQVFTKSVRKKTNKKKGQNFQRAKQKFPGARRCASILFSFPEAWKLSGEASAGRPRRPRLYLLGPLHHLLALTLCPHAAKAETGRRTDPCSRRTRLSRLQLGSALLAKCLQLDLARLVLNTDRRQRSLPGSLAASCGPRGDSASRLARIPFPACRPPTPSCHV